MFLSARGVLTTPTDDIYDKYNAAIPFGKGYSPYWVRKEEEEEVEEEVVEVW